MLSINTVAWVPLGSSEAQVLLTEVFELLSILVIYDKTVETNLASFLLKIHLLQQLTFNMVFARSIVRARICKLFARQLLCTQTPGGCGRDAQLVPSLFKLPKTFYSAARPLLATKAQSSHAFEMSRTAGQFCVRTLGLQSALVCHCCRFLAAFLQAQPLLMVLQPEPSPAWKWAEPRPELSGHILHWPLSVHICSCSNPVLTSLSSDIKQVAGLFHLHLGVTPRCSPWCRAGILRPTGKCNTKHKLSLYSHAFLFMFN